MQLLKNLWDLRNKKPNKEINNRQITNNPGFLSLIYIKIYKIENINRLRFVFLCIFYLFGQYNKNIIGITNSINRFYNPNKDPGLYKMPIILSIVIISLANVRSFFFTNSESGYKKDEKSKEIL